MTTIEHHTAHINGLDLHYVAAGSGSSLVVLLHGFPEFWYSWRQQIPALAETHRVIALDQRGYNTSSKPSGVQAYSIPNLVSDVIGLLDHLGAQKATIVGHDWGGMIAWMTAILHPERVERLAVINLPHPKLMMRALLLRNPRQMLRSWYMGFFQLTGFAEYSLKRNNYQAMKEAFKELRHGAYALTDDDIKMFVQAWDQPGALTAMLNWYRWVIRHGVLWMQRLPSFQVHVPTQLIWGTNDVALGQELTYGTERYVSDLRIRYLNGISHWAQQEAPELVNETLLGFITEHRFCN